MFRTALTAAALAAPLAAPAQPTASIPATFVDLNGREIGGANVTGTINGTLIEVVLTGLPPDSWLGFHIHELGVCDPAARFETAGDHFNPAGVEHGFLTETGPHAGDLPNLHTGPDGSVSAAVFSGLVLLVDGASNAIGRALVIHSEPDDYRSQPHGNSGDRIACAVIRR